MESSTKGEKSVSCMDLVRFVSAVTRSFLGMCLENSLVGTSCLPDPAVRATGGTRRELVFEPMRETLILVPDAQVLKVFSRFETDGTARWDSHFLACSWISTDTALARFDLKDTKTTKLDSFASLHRQTHRIEHRVHCHLGLDFCDVRCLRDLSDDVDFDHI